MSPSPPFPAASPSLPQHLIILPISRLLFFVAFCASEEAYVGHNSAYLFSDARFQCNSSYSSHWLPSSLERDSWGKLTEDSIQWGWSSDVSSCRPECSTGRPYSIFDGSLTTKFEWNCGSSAEHWVAFDLQTMGYVNDVRFYSARSSASPRRMSVYYSTDSISGPYLLWTTYEAESRSEGWKQFSAQKTIQGIYARYFKIVVETNWGNSEVTELVEVELNGYLLQSKPAESLQWIDSSKNVCNKANAISSPKWAFGFVSSPAAAKDLAAASFVVEIDSSSSVVQASAAQIELYNLFKTYGYVVSVVKNQYALGAQSGFLWEIRFYNKAPSHVAIRYRTDGDFVPTEHLCSSKCKSMPSKTRLVESFEDLAFYPCAQTNRHLVLSDFLAVAEYGSLCINDQPTENRLHVVLHSESAQSLFANDAVEASAPRRLADESVYPLCITFNDSTISQLQQTLTVKEFTDITPKNYVFNYNFGVTVSGTGINDGDRINFVPSLQYCYDHYEDAFALTNNAATVNVQPFSTATSTVYSCLCFNQNDEHECVLGPAVTFKLIVSIVNTASNSPNYFLGTTNTFKFEGSNLDFRDRPF